MKMLLTIILLALPWRGALGGTAIVVDKEVILETARQAAAEEFEKYPGVDFTFFKMVYTLDKDMKSKVEVSFRSTPTEHTEEKEGDTKTTTRYRLVCVEMTEDLDTVRVYSACGGTRAMLM